MSCVKLLNPINSPSYTLLTNNSTNICRSSGVVVLNFLCRKFTREIKSKGGIGNE